MIVGIISTGIRAGAVDISHRHKSLIRSFNRLQYFWTVQTFEEIFDRLNGLPMYVIAATERRTALVGMMNWASAEDASPCEGNLHELCWLYEARKMATD